MSDGVYYNTDLSSWQFRYSQDRFIQDSITAALNQQTYMSLRLTDQVAELRRAFDLELEASLRPKEFVIEEEPEFIWGSGSKSEPECAEAAQPR